MEQNLMKKVVQQGRLYDFYGELLTEHQKQIYEDVVFNDLSLSEIAKDHGITRQGVHDLVKRCDKILEEYEEKLQLIDKFMKTKKMVGEIKDLTAEYKQSPDAGILTRIEQISNDIIEL